jgi:hypothetical protein
MEKKNKTGQIKEHFPKSTHQGVLRLGDVTLECHVLDDRRRVFSTRDFAGAFKINFNDDSPNEAMNKFLTEIKFRFTGIGKTELRKQLASPIKFKGEADRGAVLSNGYSVELLPELCNAIMELANNYRLPLDYQQAAEQSRILLTSFAKVGIIALVDEATGYQEFRARDALQQILDRYLRAEHAAWAKRFPDEFYRQIFRLKKWELKGTQMPGVVGKYTSDVVYARLAPGILEELEQRNPVQESGYRKSKHHQFLTEDVGHPALSNHLTAVIALMKISDTWDGFYSKLGRVYPVIGQQFLFDFDGDE